MDGPAIRTTGLVLLGLRAHEDSRASRRRIGYLPGELRSRSTTTTSGTTRLRGPGSRPRTHPRARAPALVIAAAIAFERRDLHA